VDGHLEVLACCFTLHGRLEAFKMKDPEQMEDTVIGGLPGQSTKMTIIIVCICAVLLFCQAPNN
jgi:hypothetical protein